MKSPVSFICNNDNVLTELNPSSIILDFLRHHKQLTGVREGCREGDCGACTILVGQLNKDSVSYISVNSCLMPVYAAAGKHIITIEGLNKKQLSPIQQVLIEEGATQCGFCTPGFIISLTGYLISAERYNYEDAINSLGGNICRCTGYLSIKRSVKRILGLLSDHHSSNSRICYLVKEGILPDYFERIKDRLELLSNVSLTKKHDRGYIIAGGTDLYVQAEKLVVSSDNQFLDSEHSIKVEEASIVISASATVSDIRNSEIMRTYLPHIREYLDLFGSEPIRNKATLGGNICNASPSADLISIFLALNSNIIVYNSDYIRKIPLCKLFLGYKKLDLSKGEIIKELHFKIPPATALFHYEKVSKRNYLDIASVNSSICIDIKDNVINDIQISAGGVAPIPLLLSKTTEYLLGKELKKKNILKAAELLREEISPIDDIRGSAEYKRLLLRQLLLAHFIKLFPNSFYGQELL